MVYWQFSKVQGWSIRIFLRKFSHTQLCFCSHSYVYALRQLAHSGNNLCSAYIFQSLVYTFSSSNHQRSTIYILWSVDTLRTLPNQIVFSALFTLVAQFTLSALAMFTLVVYSIVCLHSQLLFLLFTWSTFPALCLNFTMYIGLFSHSLFTLLCWFILLVRFILLAFVYTPCLVAMSSSIVTLCRRYFLLFTLLALLMRFALFTFPGLLCFCTLVYIQVCLHSQFGLHSCLAEYGLHGLLAVYKLTYLSCLGSYWQLWFLLHAVWLCF